MKIKLTRCHVCNATKARRSPTAYVYCDYCGALTDFDFQLAISDKRSKLPGPEYERLRAQLAPQLEAAQKAGDQARYLELQRDLYGAYVTACPASCPPRVGDPAYRAKYIEQSARAATIGVFDPELAASSERQAKAMKALAWIPGGTMGVTCRPDTFWALYDTVVEIAETSRKVYEGHSELKALNPDGDSPVNSLLGMSTFVQGWLPYLTKSVADALMAKSGLGGQYVEPAPFSGEAVPCGGCKADVTVAAGAKRCVCDACGHLLKTDVVVPCSSCGARMLMPAERTTFQCPFCETELRTQAWTVDQLTR